MRIWFDISNSPHVNMFYHLIKELEQEGHEVLITSRPLANTIELLDQKGLIHTCIGSHYGKNLFKKLLGYPIRVFQLYRFLKNKEIDVSVSQSSFHAPLVAKLLKRPSIYTNDNEHALGNWPCFLFATRILIPETMHVPSYQTWGVANHKWVRYPGVKEGIYLWQKWASIAQQRTLINASTPSIYIRPEPNTAQYYKGKEFFLDDIILALKDTYTITILTRNQTQRVHYLEDRFKGLQVPIKPLDFDEIASKCTLFIGAGGSMTRELALLNVPTISVYQDHLLKVDQLLIEKGYMWYEPFLSEHKLKQCIASSYGRAPHLEMMEKGRQAYTILKTEILAFEVVEKFFYY